MKKKSILTKLLIGILVPAILIFAFSALSILSKVRRDITTVTEGELMAHSQAAANQVSDFFTKYTELVRQIGCNEAVALLLESSTEPGDSQQAPTYELASKSLDNILASDDNISLVWTADFDSGDSVRSGGVIRGKNTDYDITERSWYQQTMEHKELFITEPYEDSSTGKLVASIIQPVITNGKTVGLVAIDLTIDSLKSMMASYKLGDTGFVCLTTDSNTLIFHPDQALVGKNVSEIQISDNIKTALSENIEGSHIYQKDNKPIHGYVSMVGNTGWKILTGLPEAEFYQGYNNIQTTILLVFGVGLLILMVSTLLISLGIVRPLKRLKASAGKIADGNLDVEVSVGSMDEVGQLAMAIGRTVTRLKDYISYINELAHALDEIADGNFDCELTLEYAGEFSSLKHALNNISTSLSATLEQINQTSNQVSGGADQVSSGAQALAQGATEQASAVQELSATIYEISSQIKENAGNADTARNESENSAGKVLESNEKMQQMIAAMDEISGKSEEIRKIIKTIEDIAFQTNILALNAAVEAARAGASGKGFAVVADEVRNLAGKSAEAAKNTTVLIEQTVEAVANGTRIADATASAMDAVVEGTKHVTGLIEKIAAASDQQAGAVAQVNMGIEQISAVVQTNSATAEESAAASEQLSGQAQILKDLIGQFRLKNT